MVWKEGETVRLGGETMEYITVREAAQKWGISVRLVQRHCAAGRVGGVQKFGGTWAIPAGAPKPQDPRRLSGASARERGPVRWESACAEDGSMLLPLMNSAFAPGGGLCCIQGMGQGPGREIALAEHCYFRGEAQQAARRARPYLESPSLELQLSACLIYAYANLSVGQIAHARYALAQVRALLEGMGPDTPAPLRAAGAFAASAGAVLLHLPLPQGLPDAGEYLPLLPPGLRAFALYVQAHYAYLQGDYSKSLGMAEATLAMQGGRYPIPAIYLHLAAVMDHVSLRQPEQAKRHLLAAWEIARPDDFIEGFGEHHGLLGGLLEAVIKKDWPQDFKRMIAITYRFSAGWRKIHNPDTGHDVADNLTTTEFAAAMLAARGWTNQEIGVQMNISPNTVKRHISLALQKLGIRRRQELRQFLLR